MKQILFTLLMLVAAGKAVAVGDVEINEINFPDENFRSWLFMQSYGADGVLTESEIENITKFDIGSYHVVSLKGIEYFTALGTLYCNGNQLTSLDISNCTALTELYCSYNKLTSLDVSKNTNLTSLECGSNQLTYLDVSNCTALTRLKCQSNQLTILNVSKNTALTSLDCRNLNYNNFCPIYL